MAGEEFARLRGGRCGWVRTRRACVFDAAVPSLTGLLCVRCLKTRQISTVLEF
jgi:hypothetical protein